MKWRRALAMPTEGSSIAARANLQTFDDIATENAQRAPTPPSRNLHVRFSYGKLSLLECRGLSVFVKQKTSYSCDILTMITMGSTWIASRGVSNVQYFDEALTRHANNTSLALHLAMPSAESGRTSILVPCKALHRRGIAFRGGNRLPRRSASFPGTS